MPNAEDYRRRFLERPKTLAEETATKQREEALARSSYQFSEAARIAEFNQRKVDIMRHQNTLLSEAYVASGIRDRVAGLASILSSGKVVEEINIKDETIKNDDRIKIITTKVFRVPYLSFVGREIIQDNSLSEFHQGGRDNPAHTNYGQKLDDNKTLINSLAVILKSQGSPSDIKYANTFNMRLLEEHWEQKEMTWTKSWINKTGWVKRYEFGIDYDLSYENGVIRGAWADMTTRLDSAFDSLYDSYLKVTKKI